MQCAIKEFRFFSLFFEMKIFLDWLPTSLEKANEIFLLYCHASFNAFKLDNNFKSTFRIEIVKSLDEIKKNSFEV